MSFYKDFGSVIVHITYVISNNHFYKATELTLIMQEITSKKNIGERIRGLRIQHEFSQSFIADILDLSRSNYSQIELGKQYPSFNTLHTIAQYYGRSYEWLLHGTESASVGQIQRRSPASLEPILRELEGNMRKFEVSLKTLESELSMIRRSNQV